MNLLNNILFYIDFKYFLSLKNYQIYILNALKSIKQSVIFERLKLNVSK